MERCGHLVIPNLWPEPFGLVGLEAAQYGVPAVSFAVGGIPYALSGPRADDTRGGCYLLGECSPSET